MKSDNITIAYQLYGSFEIRVNELLFMLAVVFKLRNISLLYALIFLICFELNWIEFRSLTLTARHFIIIRKYVYYYKAIVYKALKFSK